MRTAVFRRIGIQSEPFSTVWLDQDRPDTVSRTAGASTARQRARGIAPRRPVDLDDAAAADHTRRCDRLFRPGGSAAALGATHRLIDNAGIHKGEAMDKKRRQWARRALYLYYLPPYSPELNRIEILWKHAKHFWRRFVAKNGADLVDEIQALMRGFGSKFTINFA